jgi:hypothetical protein
MAPSKFNLPEKLLPGLNDNFLPMIKSIFMSATLRKFKTRIISCVLFLFLSFTAIGQPDRHSAKSVLTFYLNNFMTSGDAGWRKNSQDSLSLIASDYLEKVRSYNKDFRIEQTDDVYYITSYSLDSVRIFSDYAFGYVTLEAASYGIILQRLMIAPQKIDKIYLLITKNNKWYVLSETKDWFVSVNFYIRFAEKFLSVNNPADIQYKDNVVKNLHDFRDYLNHNK